MPEPITVHTAIVGHVVATVHFVSGMMPQYYVTLSSQSADGGRFMPSELPQIAKAAEQAQHFICYQEQIARMNSCPGCGG